VKVKILALACGLGVAGFGAAGTAEAAQGGYFGVHAGITQHPDGRFTDDAGGTGTWGYKQGFGIGGSGGFAFSNGLRVEGELVYRANDVKSVEVDGLGKGSIDGNTTSTAFMANGFYDFLPNRVVNPYLGVGIGASKDHFEVSSGGNSASDDRETFAYQGIVGLQFKVARGWRIGAEYRYFATSKPGYVSGGDTMRTPYDTNNAFVTMQWSFR
jgi:OOP family OmpA-OmpF porin